MPKKFTTEFRDRAVRMVFERQAAEGGPRQASVRVVAESLGCGPETLRNWCRKAEATDPAVVPLTGGHSLRRRESTTTSRTS
ncbi:MAG: transposase [Micrococcaceae bacterium]